MPEFLVHLNPVDAGKAKGIVEKLKKQGSITPKGATVYVGVDPSIAVTRPPTARVEQVFEDVGGGVSTDRVTP